MLGRFAKSLAAALAATYVEHKFLPAIGLGYLLETSDSSSSSSLAGAYLPAGYGLVIAVVVVSYLWVLSVGMGVGFKRYKYKELAEKDGEKDVDARYLLPNLYAQGTSKHVKAFNCVQRSHQQILETFPGYLITVLISGLEFPVTTFLAGLVWLVSRMVWVKGYAASMGDPSQRYSHALSRLFWFSKLTLFFTTLMVALQLVVGRKLFW